MSSWVQIECYMVGNEFAAYDLEARGSFLYGYNPYSQNEWLFRIFGNTTVADMLMDSTGLIYCTGMVSDYNRFPEDTIQTPYFPHGYLMVVDSLGKMLHFQLIGGTGSEWGERLYALANGNIGVQGRFYGGDFHWGDSLIAAGIPSSHETWYAEFVPGTFDTTTAIHPRELLDYGMYPNPTE